MKRKSLLFVLLMALFAPLAMHAQTTVTIGEGTTTSNTNPIGTYYNYSITEQLYTAEEIGMAGTISSISFYYMGIAEKDFPITVYMANVDAADLSTGISLADADEVFSGTLSVTTTAGWVTIDLDTPFFYDGTSNLLIGFIKDYLYYFSGQSWQGTATSSTMARYTQSDSAGPYTTSTTPSSAQTNRPNIQLNITAGSAPSCPKPKQLAANCTGNTATITWTSDATNFNIDVNGVVTQNVTSPYTLGDLDFSTTYAVKVQANCGNGDLSEWTNAISFTTDLCAIEDQCEINYSFTDQYNDSWNGASIDIVDVTTNSVLYNLTMPSVTGPYTGSIAVCDGRAINFVWHSGSYDNECGYTFTNFLGEEIFSGSGALTTYNYTVDCTVPACMKPTNLVLATDGRTVTATWEGTASTYNIDINGTVTNNVTSPYTFNAELSTTYEVMVQANCDGGETSDWTNAVSITTPPCLGGHVIVYDLVDSYGDGWNGNAILVKDACDVIETLTIDNGTSNSGTLTLCDGDYYQLTWQTGNYAGETSFTLTIDGTTIFTNQSGSNLSNGQVLYTIGTAPTMPAKPTALTAGTPGAQSVELSWTENGDATTWQICVNNDEDNPIDVRENPYTLTGLTPDTEYTVKVRAINGTESCWSDEVTFTTAEACAKPTDLAEDDITTNSATLSWEGTSNSYVLQYRPWHQVGEDQVATGVLTPYTFDLSEYRGTGSVAIRHYDVSDMFQLNVDDIVVTNANGETVYTEDFEDGVVPSNISNMDLDGDGYVWGIRSNGTDGNGNDYCNGSYCASSASWDGVALYPDNWMIISGIEMGGQITFIARGQDPEWAAENFAVYVSAESDVVEETVTETTYAASNLEPNTPYAWQVKSDCGDFQSNWVSSFFKTKDDALVFAYEGDWDDLENWEDAEGNAATALPTLNNNVRIDADAEIPAGVVAQANKITIGEGSITVKDGGQLKQSSATVKVTMEKEITAYGESEGNYYFIASPFSGRTLYGDSDWNHVENMLTGEYDLYAFDPTEELEWINYKSSPTHISFQSTNGNAGLMGGEGYLYANQDGTTIMFVGSTGKSNNYIETKDFTFDGASADDFNGWALVGNFFSCNAYINYVDADGTALEADFYTLNNDNTYSLMSSNQPLPPCTGALMNVNATGKIQYATEAPATSKRTGMINMSLTQGRGNIDQVRIRFGQGHNLQHMSFRNSSKLYMTQDSKDYAVVYAENEGEMPVSFKADHNGTYTLSINTEDVEFGYLHLIDNLTGNDVDLLSTPSYNFEASTTDYASRFRLVFNANSNNDSFAFFNNGNWVITNEGDATLQVVDVMGRIISSETINGNANISINAAQGVYMLRLVNGENVKVQKVVVR